MRVRICRWWCEVCDLFGCCCTREKAPKPYTPSKLWLLFLRPVFPQTSLVVCGIRAVTPYNARHYRPYAFFYVLFCLSAACFSPRRTWMKPWLRGSVARKHGYQAHIRALDARCAWLLCVPMSASGCHVPCERQKNGLVDTVPYWLWGDCLKLCLLTMLVRCDGNAHSLLLKQTGMVGFSSSP